MTDIFLSDLCDVGGEKAEEQAGTGRLSRATDRVYQAVGDYNQAP